MQNLVIAPPFKVTMLIFSSQFLTLILQAMLSIGLINIYIETANRLFGGGHPLTWERKTRAFLFWPRKNGVITSIGN